MRRLLGLARGGAAACTALALLAGGDYDLGGADAVGRVGAMRVVRHLLAGREDDAGVLARLRALVAAGADPAVQGLVKCTGVLLPLVSLSRILRLFDCTSPHGNGTELLVVPNCWAVTLG